MLGYVVEKIACYYKKKKNNHKGPELWLHNLFSITEEKIVFLNFFFFLLVVQLLTISVQ